MTSKPVKFLLVDDLPENLLALEALLRKDGLEILKATSANQALEILLADGDIALAILDVQMPETDGFQLAEMMRASPRTKHIPIIFLTAGTFDEGRRFRGYETGAVDFLSKPVETFVLRSKADVFFDLFLQRQIVVQQRDDLKAAMEENDRLYKEIVSLNASLEERVGERTSQLMDANEQLQGFSYSVAHDFRQHIRGISTNASLLLEECGDVLGEHRERVERLRDIAVLMGRMTDDLLMYARMRTAEVCPVAIDLTGLAAEIAASLQTRFPETDFTVAEGLTVTADPTMVRIAIQNLLDNAFKYSHRAEHPRVELGPAPNGFYVRDNGIGIDMAYADRLFRPFERLVPASQYFGTGMGLANVKRIVERHKGSIRIDPDLAVGSKFIVEFPPLPSDKRSP